MRKQRFPFSISYWTGVQNDPHELRAGEHFHFDLDGLNHFCLSELPPRLIDLLRVASSIYVVDRLVKRHPQRGPNQPARTIGIKINVLDQTFWNRNEVRDAIGEALDFVSGDCWEIEFGADSAGFSQAKPAMFDLKDDVPPLVSLYSGGLDSAAGLVVQLASSAERPMVPVTVWHQPGQRHLLKKQYQLIRQHFGGRIAPLIVKVGMNWRVLDQRNEEHSQRCRSFLFVSLGAIAAIMTGQKSVEMFESGVGAINLPLMAGMVGPKTTRSSHPEFLRLMSRLLSLVAQDEITIALPFFNQTKGEVVKRLADHNLQELANLTTSCVGYPLRNERAKQCGYCPACVFRRQAMFVAGMQEPEGAYKYDFLSDPVLATQISQKRFNYLKAFLMQVAQLNAVGVGRPLPASIARHLIGTGVLTRNQPQDMVIDLLSRFREEWMAMASFARRKGLGWARLLNPSHLQPQGVSHASV